MGHDTMQKTTCTFEVADVPLASERFPTLPPREAMFHLLTRDQVSTTTLSWELGSYSFPVPIFRALQDTKVEHCGIEACSGEDRMLLAGVSLHPLVFAAHASFCLHYPLVLSPDMVWLLVIQGVAEHINSNAERLRPLFVQHEGRLEINVRRDDLVRGLPDQPWREVVAEFAARIREHVGNETCDLFEPRFSTTREDDRTACCVVLMNAVGQYFDYRLETVCGIPRISLEGSPEDWWLLLERTSAFRGFDLDWWTDPLTVALRQIALTREGKENRPFWNSLYRMSAGSGRSSYFGWLGIFFPYLRAKEGQSIRNPLVSALSDYLRDVDRGRPSLGAAESRLSFPRPGDLGKGITSAPFTWDYRFKSSAMEFLSGFVGVTQDSETLALRPEIGWAVRDRGVTKPTMLPHEFAVPG